MQHLLKQDYESAMEAFGEGGFFVTEDGVTVKNLCLQTKTEHVQNLKSKFYRWTFQIVRPASDLSYDIHLNFHNRHPWTHPTVVVPHTENNRANPPLFFPSIAARVFAFHHEKLLDNWNPTKMTGIEIIKLVAKLCLRKMRDPPKSFKVNLGPVNMHHILTHLTLKDGLLLRTVCKHFRDAADSEAYFLELFRRSSLWTNRSVELQAALAPVRSLTGKIWSWADLHLAYRRMYECHAVNFKQGLLKTYQQTLHDMEEDAMPNYEDDRSRAREWERATAEVRREREGETSELWRLAAGGVAGTGRMAGLPEEEARDRGILEGYRRRLRQRGGRRHRRRENGQSALLKRLEEGHVSLFQSYRDDQESVIETFDAEVLGAFFKLFHDNSAQVIGWNNRHVRNGNLLDVYDATDDLWRVGKVEMGGGESNIISLCGYARVHDIALPGHSSRLRPYRWISRVPVYKAPKLSHVSSCVPIDASKKITVLIMSPLFSNVKFKVPESTKLVDVLQEYYRVSECYDLVTRCTDVKNILYAPLYEPRPAAPDPDSARLSDHDEERRDGRRPRERRLVMRDVSEYLFLQVDALLFNARATVKDVDVVLLSAATQRNRHLRAKEKMLKRARVSFRVVVFQIIALRHMLKLYYSILKRRSGKSRKIVIFRSSLVGARKCLKFRLGTIRMMDFPWEHSSREVTAGRKLEKEKEAESL